MPPEKGAAEATGDTNVARNGAATAESDAGVAEGSQEQQTAATSPISRSVMDRLGVPEELRKEIGLGEAEAETEGEEPEGEKPEGEKPEGEQPKGGQPEGEKPEGEQAEGESGEDAQPPAAEEAEQPHDEKPNDDWSEPVKKEFTKRVGKLTAQKAKEKARADAAEAERDDLKGKLESAQPVTITPTSENPLGHIDTLEQLEHVRNEAELTIDWCEANADGTVIVNDKGEERTITSDKVAETKRKARLALRAIPKREKFIEQRTASDKIARVEYPRLFETGTPEQQFSLEVMKEMPWIATHPARNMILGDYMVGWGIRYMRDQEAAKKGANGAPATAEKKTPDSKDPLKRTIPPIAQHVARTPSRSGAPNGQKKVDDAMNNVVEEGGSRESLAAAIGALRRGAASVTDKRSAALV